MVFFCLLQASVYDQPFSGVVSSLIFRLRVGIGVGGKDAVLGHKIDLGRVLKSEANSVLSVGLQTALSEVQLVLTRLAA